MIVRLSVLAVAALLAGPAAAMELHVGIASEPWNLDPALYTDIGSAWLIQNIYDPLIELSVTGQPVPEYSLCTSWEFNADATSVVLHIRKGVRFHDGRRLTAEDVKYNFDWILNPSSKSPMRSVIGPVEAVEVLSPEELRVTFSRPFPQALIWWHRALAGIVPRGARDGVTGESPLSRHPIGTGPFAFSRWVRGVKIVLEPFRDYWRAGAPAPGIEKVVFEFFPDQAAKTAALLAGAIQLVDWVSPRDYLALSRAAGVEVARIPGVQHQYIALNLASHPFGITRDEVGDARALDRALAARKFIYYALDRAAIRDRVFYGMATVLPGPWYPDSPWFSPKLREAALPDPERARDYLEEYYALGGKKPLSFTIIATSSGWFVDEATLIQSQLSRYGVEVEVIPLEKHTLFATLKTTHWQAAVEDWAHGIPDVLRWLYAGYVKVPNHDNWYHASPDLPDQFFPTQPGHEEFCRLYQEAVGEPDEERRRELVWRMEEMLVEDVIRVDLVMVDSLLAWRSGLSGYREGAELIGSLHLGTITGVGS